MVRDKGRDHLAAPGQVEEGVGEEEEEAAAGVEVPVPEGVESPEGCAGVWREGNGAPSPDGGSVSPFCGVGGFELVTFFDFDFFFGVTNLMTT